MAPIFALLLGKVLEYLADNAEEIVEKIREQFSGVKDDPEVKTSLQEFGFDPTEETLTNLNDVLESKGEDTQKLARVILNNANV